MWNQLKAIAQSALDFLLRRQPKSTGKPHQRRTSILYQLFALAWKQGLRKYAEIIEFVKQETGTGCSRRPIARWKKEQGLLRA